MLQSPHFSHICHCLRPLRLALLASSPKGGAKGGCAAGGARSNPLWRRLNRIVISMRWAGSARPLALPMGELARLKAVTERVPGRNHRIFSKFATANALSVSLRSPAPPKGEPRAAAPPGAHGSAAGVWTEGGRLRRRGCGFCAAGGAIFVPPGGVNHTTGGIHVSNQR